MKFLKKTPVLSLRFGILILAFVECLIYSPHDASGAGMSTTRFTGIVQSIDPKSKTIILKQVSTAVQLKLSWFWDTTFRADEKRVKSDALKVGTQVEVRYHSPLFGREYAISIEWHSATKQSSRSPIPAEARFPDCHALQRQQLSARCALSQRA